MTNYTPAPQQPVKAGSGIIMQDQSFSSGMYQQQTMAGSSNLSMIKAGRVPTQMSPVLQVPMMNLKTDTANSLDINDPNVSKDLPYLQASRDEPHKKTYESLLSNKDQVKVSVNKNEEQTVGIFDSAKALADVNSVITQEITSPEKPS